MGQNHNRGQCREDVQCHRVEGKKCQQQRVDSHDVTLNKQLPNSSIVRRYPFVFSKLGWSIGPEHLIKHLQTVMQNTLYTCPTPLQVSALPDFSIGSVKSLTQLFAPSGGRGSGSTSQPGANGTAGLLLLVPVGGAGGQKGPSGCHTERCWNDPNHPRGRLLYAGGRHTPEWATLLIFNPPLFLFSPLKVL